MIKALYDHTAPSEPPHYLSFSAGDFLHVVGREEDPDWYEACNPLHGSRGLVPVRYFETIGKTVRDSRSSATSGSSAPHDSGYADGSMSRSNIAFSNGAPPMPIMSPQHRQSASPGKLGNGAMVYGVVSYDFHAERPDELEAKEGEAIIVIAQSNPEWFVAKPITRLGGPGLIPVSFIEIKDMHTGQTVTDPAEAVARAGIPRVEEWKKMAADYKNTSIPLGQFGTSGHVPSGSVSGLQQGMDRMSLGQQSNGYDHSRTSSNSNNYPPQSYHLAPVRASVPRFLYAEEKFHFIVECALANGSHWDLSRIYEDFYELQINLIKAFPNESGQTGQQRTLPYMPGPVQFVTDKISEGRRENLDEYLHNLLRLAPHITNSLLVRRFFSPRNGDYEVDPNAVDLNEHSRSQAATQQDRYSQASMASQNPYGQQAAYGGPQQLRQPHQRAPSNGNGAFRHQRSQQSLGSQRGDFRTPSDYGSAPPMNRQLTQQSNLTTTSSASNSTAIVNTALKVKVWFDRDTCVVVRMPPKRQFQFADLYHKICERRKLEYSNKKDSAGSDGLDQENGEVEPRLEIEYRDERDGEYYRLADDEELEQAVGTNEKLTLVVRQVGDADA